MATRKNTANQIQTVSVGKKDDNIFLKYRSIHPQFAYKNHYLNIFNTQYKQSSVAQTVGQRHTRQASAVPGKGRGISPVKRVAGKVVVYRGPVVLRQQVFPVGIAVGVVHRAERLAGGAGGVSVLALCLAMCYISKPIPRNNLYTKNMLI